MGRVAQRIEETTDVRELKRALSVKLPEGGMAPEAGGEGLQVTPRAGRAWRQRYERGGGEGLRGRYRGSESDRSVERRRGIADWLGAQATCTVGEVRAELDARYGMVYQSKPSYYDLLDASGRRYHRTEKGNPKRGAAHVLKRREGSKKNWRRAGPRLSAGR